MLELEDDRTDGTYRLQVPRLFLCLENREIQKSAFFHVSTNDKISKKHCGTPSKHWSGTYRTILVWDNVEISKKHFGREHIEIFQLCVAHIPIT